MQVIQDMNDNFCKEEGWLACDRAGRTRSYTMAWIYAIVLDIAIPVLLFISGIVFGFAAMILGIIIPGFGAIIPGIGAFVFGAILIIAMIAVTYLLFREIGVFILIPVAISITILIIFFLAFLFIVPWNIIAVYLHQMTYKTPSKASAK